MTARRRRPGAPPVVALVPDGPAAVPVVRIALRIAQDARLPLVLLVALPALGLTTDPVVLRSAHQRRAEEAAAVLARVAPTLAGSRVEVREEVVAHPVRGRRGLPAAVADAVRRRAARRGAAVLVAPDDLPLPPSTAYPTFLIPLTQAPEEEHAP